jgi:hypothetical protein
MLVLKIMQVPVCIAKPMGEVPAATAEPAPSRIAYACAQLPLYSA